MRSVVSEIEATLERKVGVRRVGEPSSAGGHEAGVLARVGRLGVELTGRRQVIER
jgi:hypothetical protein